MLRYGSETFAAASKAAASRAILSTLISACLVATGAAACAQPSGPAVVLRPDDDPVRVRVEFARSPSELARGLMFRDHLDADAGMLFVFPDSRPRRFWMKNTPISLDIIFLDAEGVVVAVAHDTVPYSLAGIPSGEPARYVLEVNAGFARRHGIEKGTRAALPETGGD